MTSTAWRSRATMVNYSNYSYEPSLGRKVTVGRPDVDDYDVAEAGDEQGYPDGGRCRLVS